jgi:hypothetical protein
LFCHTWCERRTGRLLYLLCFSGTLLPDRNCIILYNHLHMQRELEAIPALFMRAFLKDFVDGSENREWLAFGKPLDQEDFLSTLEEAFNR